MEALPSPPPSCRTSLDRPSSPRLFCASPSSSASSSPAARNAFLHRSSLSCSWSTHVSARRPSHLSVRCCCSNQDPSSSSSNAAGAWDDDDCNYLEAHVVDAVSLLPYRGHLFMTLSNGGEVQIDHINPSKRPFLFRARNPTIFLKISSETDLILPIIVRDSAIDMLMSALHGQEKMLRPNQYQIMMDLVLNLQFEVRMVRITERINDTYIARIYVGKQPGHREMQSIDARPSDAVNLAVRCKVPIYVHKDLVASDAVKPAVMSPQPTEMATNSNAGVNSDIPNGGKDHLSEEMTLVKNMVLAVEEERYSDAAHWRDELKRLRGNR